jgi:hypothetical protein
MYRTYEISARVFPPIAAQSTPESHGETLRAMPLTRTLSAFSRLPIGWQVDRAQAGGFGAVGFVELVRLP